MFSDQWDLQQRIFGDHVATFVGARAKRFEKTKPTLPITRGQNETYARAKATEMPTLNFLQVRAHQDVKRRRALWKRFEKTNPNFALNNSEAKTSGRAKA